MPRPKGSFKALPDYRLHKASGRAVVTLAGRDHYLGVHGSRESRAAYDRLIGEWLAGGRVATPVSPDGVAPPAGISVVEVIAAFWRHAQTYYRKPDGTPTSELKNLRDALRPLKRLYGAAPAASFGPVALRALREEMIKLGWCRTNINRQVNRIRHVFKWAAGRELIPSTVYHALQAVEGLKAGRSAARESDAVVAVPDDHALAVLPFLSAQVKAMAELQLLTGEFGGSYQLLLRPRASDFGGTVRKRPLSLDEHQALGAEFDEIRGRLQDITADLVERYGKSGRVGGKAMRLERALDAVRAALDGQLCQDHPDGFDTRIYYPPFSESRDERRAGHGLPGACLGESPTCVGKRPRPESGAGD